MRPDLRKISRFQMESTKLILNLEDALVTINVGEAEADILNEVGVNFSVEAQAELHQSAYFKCKQKSFSFRHGFWRCWCRRPFKQRCYKDGR
jgi:hypothetical protein